MRDNSGNDRGRRSKSRKKNIECHYCHKQGHFEKDYYALKHKEKDNIKSKGGGCHDIAPKLDQYDLRCLSKAICLEIITNYIRHKMSTSKLYNNAPMHMMCLSIVII